MAKPVFVFEGIDRLGKSSIADEIQHQLGFYQLIHFTKPRRLEAYLYSVCDQPAADPMVYNYQQECYRNSMILAQSGARLIFDRWHLSEAVYAPMYRGYDAGYVFDMEKRHGLDQTNGIRLILLTEDFSCSRHFVSDGNSFDDSERAAEQGAFLRAFDRSAIRDKRVVCVTDRSTGMFRDAYDIIDEVLA